MRDSWGRVVEYDKLAWSVAWRAWNSWQPWWADVHDLHSEALLGVHRAAERFSEEEHGEDRGSLFKTFAYTWAWGRVRRFLSKRPSDWVEISEAWAVRDPRDFDQEIENRVYLGQVCEGLPRDKVVNLVGKVIYGLTDEQLLMAERNREAASRLKSLTSV